MLDFTSALYLGMRHPSASLPAWSAFTLGRPAALQEPPGAAVTAARLAALMGTEAATLLPSTLHLFWDLFGLLSRGGTTLYVDAATYPIAQWGAQRGVSLGARILVFPAHDAEALRRLIERTADPGRQPVIVSDTVRPGADHQPPLARYADLARSYDGYLVLDDTQALGLFGYGASAAAPYGLGGGGSLVRWGLSGPHIIVGASLAKGFGVPVAVLAASRGLVGQFEEASETRVHASPPSVAVIAATRHALDLNQKRGDALRRRLLQLVRYFRRSLARCGMSSAGGDFPVQSMDAGSNAAAAGLYQRLLDHGVQAVLHRERAAKHARLSFLFTAAHNPQQIEAAVRALHLIGTRRHRSRNFVPEEA